MLLKIQNKKNSQTDEFNTIGDSGKKIGENWISKAIERDAERIIASKKKSKSTDNPVEKK
ncbi:MAG: hypothetical protein KAR54_00235 [Candidatus Pacebacteria bacterium]|nr:hypothetical protein [Candidatus Paceibacterota bacterium]